MTGPWQFSVFVLLAPLSIGLERQAQALNIPGLVDRMEAYPAKTGVFALAKGGEPLIARAWLADHATSAINLQCFIYSTGDIGTLASEVQAGIGLLRTDCGPVVRCQLWVAKISRTALVHTSLTPQGTQKDHSQEQFWPNRFLGRWLKGLSWSLRRNSADDEGAGWERPRGSRS